MRATFSISIELALTLKYYYEKNISIVRNLVEIIFVKIPEEMLKTSLKRTVREAVTGSSSIKNAFLKLLEKSQEDTCARVFFIKC